MATVSYGRGHGRISPLTPLGASASARAVPPLPLGLVRHLSDVERRWFRAVLAGHDVELRFSSTDVPGGDFDGAGPEPGVVAESWAAWRAEVAFAEAFVVKAPHLVVEGRDAWRGTVSLRWVLLHMIEEYARHNGHADLIRERIDGAVGV
ncbi:Mini-circle protein [Streptomyces leeuwenhoekii]|uniref:Mini-circle protein n=1 Tax=Streptomyces leeuwenhoekii TaxID=1437453 RepID=A0ABR5HUJ3_STRLW|nr:Mini-circle protein [Streptomyces leeuwenhoekii]